MLGIREFVQLVFTVSNLITIQRSEANPPTSQTDNDRQTMTDRQTNRDGRHAIARSRFNALPIIEHELHRAVKMTWVLVDLM